MGRLCKPNDGDDTANTKFKHKKTEKYEIRFSMIESITAVVCIREAPVSNTSRDGDYAD
jgi:hypothetical protein